MSAGGHSLAHASCFVRLLCRLFHACGLWVADHDKFTLIAVLIFTFITSFKVAITPQQDDIKTGYTPYDARSLKEIDRYNEFFASTGDPVTVMVFITAKDGGSLFRPAYMNDTVQLMDYIGGNITHKGRSFYSFCTDFCKINEPVRQFHNGMLMKSLQSHSEGEEDRIKLKFPIMEVMGKELDLSPNFFGVRSNATSGEVKTIKCAMLQFRADRPSDWVKDDVAAYERSISTFVHKEYNSTFISAKGFSLTFVADEIVRTGMTIFPYIAVGFTIMSTFSVITIYFSSSRMKQWSPNMISLAILGCVCPLLATGSALGTLFWFGVRFGTILCVTPFLVLAIGVDDAYLQMHSWMTNTYQNPHKPRRERIAEMLVDTGPSISITSLTNFFAFLVGIYTPTPEIQLFCIGNALAIIYDYFYQITLYTAIISLIGAEREESDQTVQWEKESVDSATWEDWLDDYSTWVSSGFTAAFLAIALVAYWYISIKGALEINISLSADKLIIEGSELIEINHLRENYVLPNYTTVNLFVNKPGDLHEPAQLARVEAAIAAFEAYPECLGPAFSHFWIRDYRSYMNDGGVEMEEEEGEASSLRIYDKPAMRPFLTWPEFEHWNAFVKFDNQSHISRFFATVSYHGAGLGVFQKRKEMLMRWRATADEFKDLEVSVFDDLAPSVDQVDTILPVTISTSLCTLVTMMIVCFVFVYNAFVVSVATFAIMSICIGVFGLLSYWGIDLDPISMATTIMSIGFSVDFPAHITYHYYREGLEEPDSPPSRRVARSLLSIGFPLLQCGISTILFVCCLLFVDTYMSEVFVKTMVLVVVLGLIHGLFVVPALLCALTHISNSCCGRRRKVAVLPVTRISIADIDKVQQISVQESLSGGSSGEGSLSSTPPPSAPPSKAMRLWQKLCGEEGKLNKNENVRTKLNESE